MYHLDLLKEKWDDDDNDLSHLMLHLIFLTWIRNKSFQYCFNGELFLCFVPTDIQLNL